MKRILLIVIILAAAAAAYFAYRSTGPVSSPPTAAAPAPRAAASSAEEAGAAAPDMPVGGSCQASCSGQAIEIVCAQGETPKCDCAATPRTQCLPPAKP